MSAVAAERAAALRAASAASAEARDWWEDHDNLAELWRFLEDRGEQPNDPAYFLDKPWKWDPEYQQMRSEQAAAA